MRRKAITPRIITDDEILYLVHNGGLNVKGNRWYTLSVIPIRGDAAGISLYNLEYPLDNFTLDYAQPRGISLSVIPIRGDAAGISLYNLEYPLDNFTMDYAQPRGISNVMLGDECTVERKNGSAIVVRNLKEV